MKKNKRIWKPDYKFNPEIHGEANNEKSMTVSGEAFTVAELYKRAVAGLPLSVKQGYYSELDPEDLIDLDKINSMDIYDRNLILEEIKLKIDSLKNESERILKEAQSAEKPQGEKQ